MVVGRHRRSKTPGRLRAAVEAEMAVEAEGRGVARDDDHVHPGGRSRSNGGSRSFMD